MIRLRRFRGLSQAQLAAAVKTSQSKIARIEGATENVTVGTMERLAAALSGRLRFGIEPSELEIPQTPSWWEWVRHGGWSGNTSYLSCRVITNATADLGSFQAVAAWTGEHRIASGIGDEFEQGETLRIETDVVLGGDGAKSAEDEPQQRLLKAAV
ncbi:MAG TPA: helix-turn-helix transcriptional regulator [Gemmatimonadales bacterium]|nr:helix-turn-helix transcriptional regulator [Gemmatimonadales bacterium]